MSRSSESVVPKLRVRAPARGKFNLQAVKGIMGKEKIPSVFNDALLYESE